MAASLGNEQQNMKLIKPSLISGEIMTLIQEADSTLIIVSPYYKINQWNKLINALKFPINKKIDIEFYVRKGEYESIQQVRNLNFEPKEIKRLHTKLYINEDYAIVSSMNLVESSDKDSLDIAYRTETKKEYQELLEYYDRYIQNNTSFSKKLQTKNIDKKYQVTNGNWLPQIETILQRELGKKFYSKFQNGSLILNGPNQYYAHISNNYGKNSINICGIVSNKEYGELVTNPEVIHKHISIKKYFKENGNYSFQNNSIWYHSNIDLKSSYLEYLYKEDYDTVIDTIIGFIIDLQNFKEDLYYKERPAANNGSSQITGTPEKV